MTDRRSLSPVQLAYVQGLVDMQQWYVGTNHSLNPLITFVSQEYGVVVDDPSMGPNKKEHVEPITFYGDDFLGSEFVSKARQAYPSS